MITIESIKLLHIKTLSYQLYLPYISRNKYYHIPILFMIVLCSKSLFSLNISLIKNTPGVKKEQPRTKTGLAEKDVKSNG